MQIVNEKSDIPKVEKISLLLKTINSCTRTQQFAVPAFNDWDVIAMISEFLLTNGGRYVSHIMTEYWQKPTKGKYGISYHYIDLKYVVVGI